MESRASSRVVPVALPSFLSTLQPLYLNITISQRNQGLIRVADPGCESRIPDPYFSIPDPGSRVNKVPDPGSATTSKILSKFLSSRKNRSRGQTSTGPEYATLKSGQDSFFYN